MSKSIGSNPSSLLLLPGVGKQIAAHLERLGITTIPDLLLHFPMKYQDRTKPKSIRSTVVGEDAVIEAEIQAVQFPHRGKTKLLCTVSDQSGLLHLRFFQIYQQQKAFLRVGERIRCIGQIKYGPTGLEMIHPEIHLNLTENPLEKYLTPFYPATEGLHQNLLRKLVKHALIWLEQTNYFSEVMPESLLQHFSLPTLKQAISFIHQPSADTDLNSLSDYQTKFHHRVIFEELLAHRLSVLLTKKLFHSQRSVCLSMDSNLVQRFIDQLPYSLTSAQLRVIKEIQKDLAQPLPMLRLVQGDVGSGKTVVAASAMLQAVANGCQAVLMAPTELLAEQHFQVFSKWLSPLGIPVSFLSGSLKSAPRNKAIEAIKSGMSKVVIGTHALFQQKIAFNNLALVVVDEQHRFGVEQRAALLQKGTDEEYCPHQLVLSATPIPRTLAMSVYADLDCSTIDELPKGRTPIQTSLVANSRRNEVIDRLRLGCREGKQVYWVCPLIDESEVIECQAANETAVLLAQSLPEFKIGLIHGRMPSQEKDQIMQSFKEGLTQILVATTVIEVGVDVPNASIIVIENAERLGLAQLHQLRGRVGRGAQASHCLLLYQAPLSKLAEERLRTIRQTCDGFVIAQRDLELRGPGEIFGVRQTGALTLRIANLIRDHALLPKVQQAADFILQQHAAIIDPIVKRWVAEKKELANV